MRIAILTLPLHTNYGGILQCFALQTILKQLGHEVIEIEFEKYQQLKLPLKKYLKVIPRRIISKCLGRYKEPIFFEHYFNKTLLPKLKAEQDSVQSHTKQFIDSNINRIIVSKPSEISKLNLDAFVVGSDQIWRAPSARYNFGSVATVYLDFIKRGQIKKIGYSISFGTDVWEYSDAETHICTDLIKEFDAVSVREDSAVHLCSEKLSYNKAVQVIDPTMLLDKDNYLSLITGYQLSEGNLFAYILDDAPECNKLIKSVTNMTGLKPFFVNSKEDDAERQPQPPVERWLAAFRDANMVVTDSFHGCVFSIIFNKPFWVIGNKKRGYARFESLLKLFELQNRLITEDNSTTDWSQSIDWIKVNDKRAQLRNVGLNFLKSNL